MRKFKGLVAINLNEKLEVLRCKSATVPLLGAKGVVLGAAIVKTLVNEVEVEFYDPEFILRVMSQMGPLFLVPVIQANIEAYCLNPSLEDCTEYIIQDADLLAVQVSFTGKSPMTTWEEVEPVVTPPCTTNLTWAKPTPKPTPTGVMSSTGAVYTQLTCSSKRIETQAPKDTLWEQVVMERKVLDNIQSTGSPWEQGLMLSVKLKTLGAITRLTQRGLIHETPFGYILDRSLKCTGSN